MILKLLTAIIVLLAVGMMLTGRRIALPQRRTAPPVPRAPLAEELVKCERCGVWLPAGQRCNCAGGA